MTTLDLCRKVAEVWGWEVRQNDSFCEALYVLALKGARITRTQAARFVSPNDQVPFKDLWAVIDSRIADHEAKHHRCTHCGKEKG